MTEYNVDPTNRKGLFGSINFKPTLEEVLKTAKTGDVITLSPGTYDLEEKVTLKPDFGDDNSAVINDSAYIEAYLKTGRKEKDIPTEALIIRGASNNADDVHLVGNILIDNSNIIFENITVENKNDDQAIIGDNSSNIAFINCILTEAEGQYCPLVVGEDKSTVLNFSCSYIAEKENLANVYFKGALNAYNTNLRSGLLLRENAIASIFQSNVNWVEARDDSYAGMTNSKADGNFYSAFDSAQIEFYGSAIKLDDNSIFAGAKDNARLLGKDVYFEGSEHIPTIELLDNATAEFNIVNQNDFFAGKQVKIVHGDNDESESTDTDNDESVDDTNEDVDLEDATDDISDDADLDDTNDADNGNTVVVSNNQELIQAAQHSPNGTVITLEAGDYYYDSDVNVFNSLTFECDDITNTSLTFNKQIQVQEGCVLTFNNLAIREDENYGNTPLLVANQNNTKIVFNNCVITHFNRDEALICALTSGASIELNSVSFLNAHGGPDVAANYGGEVTIEDSFLTYVSAMSGGNVSITTSNVSAVIVGGNCNVDIKNSVITWGISALEQSNVTLVHVTIDSLRSEGMLINLSGNSRIEFYNSAFHNEHGKIIFDLADQSSLLLNLWQYNENYPVTVKCNNPDEQINNPQEWALDVKN